MNDECVTQQIDRYTYFDVFVSIVMLIKRFINSGTAVYMNIISRFYTLANSLTRVFLHLDVIELSASEKKNK